MRCFLCGNRIRPLRSLVDRQYCCSEHRKEASLASAQALRDQEDLELWSVTKSKRKLARPGNSSYQTVSIFGLLTMGGLLVAALILPGPGTAYPRAFRDTGTRVGLFQRVGDAIIEIVRRSAPVT